MNYRAITIPSGMCRVLVRIKAGPRYQFEPQTPGEARALLACMKRGYVRKQALCYSLTQAGIHAAGVVLAGHTS